jgi:hypothetical protein
MAAEPGAFWGLFLSDQRIKRGARNMPDSAVLTFTDPDAYYATIRTAEVKGVVTVRGDYRAELTRIELHCLPLRRSSGEIVAMTDAPCKGTIRP